VTKRAAVTGLGGFIGRHCVAPLVARGFEVHGIGRGDRPVWLSAEVPWHPVDLVAPGAAAAVVRDIAPSHLLNLAWYTAHGSYWRSPENAAWVRAGIELIEAFAAAGGSRFVGAGSCAEYDWDFGFLSERVTPLRPRTPFGRFKAALGEASGAFAEASGLSFAWGRVFFVYGPHEREGRLGASVIGSLLAGRPVKTTHGRQIRDFSHVADIGAAFAALLDAEATGAVNLGSGRPTAVREIIEEIARIVGLPELVAFGALPLAPDEPPLLVADVRRLRDEVGFTPDFDLAAGLRQTVAAFCK